ncbi:MAG: ATP synthase subunit I [Eubacteriaceae bacterium]|nr:ATP synthase subunit I [Eubacteriaceae bacterium]
MSQRNSIREKFKNADLLSFTSICVGAVVICVILCIAGLLFSNRREFISGILFGLIFSIINFRLLKSAMERSVYKEDSKAAAFFVTIQYFVRFVMKAGALYIGFASDRLDTVAVIVGLLSVNIAIYVLNLINTKKTNKE